jgi:hypothetical protein
MERAKGSTFQFLRYPNNAAKDAFFFYKFVNEERFG